MILIADSSALITLSIMDSLELLEKIFGKVYIPQAVFDEITYNGKVESEKLKLFCNDKIRNIKTDINFNISLGKGESEAIILYKEKNADFLLCDDKKAKNFAKSFDINVIGSLGILLKAKEKNLITNVSPLLEILKKSDLYIDKEVYKLVLKIADE